MIAPARSIPRLRSPLVLVHGLFGFDQVRLGPWIVANYFAGIPPLLKSAGNKILIPCLGATNGVAERAAQLRDYLDREMPHEPVHIIAHSMGGLDARYMISRLGMGHRVLSLTTLGTPHRGCSFAAWGIRRLERLVRPVLHLFGFPTQAFYDLTPASCHTFNEQVLDQPGVRYFSVAGRHEPSYLAPEWLLPHSIVSLEEGPNDGVVSIASAAYGEMQDIWEGDHFSLVNWLHPLGRNRGFGRDPWPRYGPLIRRLADAGF